MASLDSVRQKVIRAYNHLKSLREEALRYFGSNPGEVVAETETNSGRIVLIFKTRIPVPVSVPLIIGDAVQNLRSSLDYLVWELVLAANNQPTEKNMFPICTSPEAFKDQLSRGRLTGIAPDALTEIEALQPYHYGQDCERAPIRVLDSFCNINKHRRVLVTVLAVHASRTDIISSATGYSVQQTFSPRYHNTEIAVGPAYSVPGETVEMKGDALFFITFDEGVAKDIEVASCLRQLWGFVNDDVLSRFEKFFV